nr:unnamed protein product [Spirometra erinaceieuropaei]
MNTLKISVKRPQTNLATWKDLARDRQTWRRTVKTDEALFKVNLISPVKAKQEARKSQQPPLRNDNVQPSPICPRLQRTFRTPFGRSGGRLPNDLHSFSHYRRFLKIASARYPCRRPVAFISRHDEPYPAVESAAAASTAADAAANTTTTTTTTTGTSTTTTTTTTTTTNTTTTVTTSTNAATTTTTTITTTTTTTTANTTTPTTTTTMTSCPPISEWMTSDVQSTSNIGRILSRDLDPFQACPHCDRTFTLYIGLVDHCGPITQRLANQCLEHPHTLAASASTALTAPRAHSLHGPTRSHAYSRQRNSP